MNMISPAVRRPFSIRMAVLLVFASLLAGCDEQGGFNLNSSPEVKTETAEDGSTIRFTEEEVEKPDVFYAKEPGLWDGRPTFGGVWVSHPDTTQPEKVIIRNKSNGRFVIGALFRVERDLPGPSLRLSSDAAEAINVLAGAPVELEVVALRTEKIPVEEPEPEPEIVEAPAEIEEQTLDPIVAAGAAIETAPPTAAEAGGAAVSAEAVASNTKGEEAAPASSLSNPYVQVASFSVEKNAEAVSEQMNSLGLNSEIRTEEVNGKPLWRVLIGPIGTRSERRQVLRQVRDEGYADAYSVKQ